MTESLQARLKPLMSGVGIAVLIALAMFALHMLTNQNYGLHRDELATLDESRFMDWGFVAYPPITPLLGRLGMALFGLAPAGVRMISALAQAAAVVVAAVMARDLGGGRFAQVVAALAVTFAPISMSSGTTLMYVSFDYLWWAVLAWCVIRLFKSGNPRWWLAIGAVIGLGMMTKFTMGFVVAGLVVGVLATPARKQLASPWLWGGAALALLIFLPNLIWQIQHNFISLQFLSSIHQRDIGEGRADSFYTDQLYLTTSLAAVPLWIAGLYYYLFRKEGAAYRVVGWMYVIPAVLFAVSRGRGYYLGAAYPMLFAAGSVALDGWLKTLTPGRATAVRWAQVGGLVIIGALFGAVILPIAPINSPVFKTAAKAHDLFTEQIGWDDLVHTVTGIYNGIPPEERAHTGILVGNYGEAGAIDLYGKAYGLPDVISGVNTYWLRTYPTNPPQTLIVVGFDQASINAAAADCTLAGHNTNRYGIVNEESRDHPDIFLCRNLHVSWPDLWKQLQSFG